MNLGRPNKNWTSLTLCAPDSSHQSISFVPASNYFGHKILFFFRERNAASFMLHTRCCHSKWNKNLRWPMRWLVVVFLGHQWLKRAPSFPCIWCNKKKKKAIRLFHFLLCRPCLKRCLPFVWLRQKVSRFIIKSAANVKRLTDCSVVVGWWKSGNYYGAVSYRNAARHSSRGKGKMNQ